jgi:2-polyprenyl-6-methoxyphenol hydroxylase-like FAD-dependent oxidoreductase
MTAPHNARRIAIVGAGPAGLVAAIAARRAGFLCSVYEQAPSFERVGGAVGIASNGLQVLAALGLLDRFRAHIELLQHAQLEAPPGRVLTRANFRDSPLPHVGFAVALRYDLHEVLADCARAADVALHFDARCTGAQWQPHGVRLHFADGNDVEAPLVFACDGVNSVVRSALGFKSKKQTIGEAYLRLVAPIAHPDPERAGEYWAADGRRAGAFPLPGQRTYVFCSVPLGRWQEILNGRLEAWLSSWTDFGEPIVTLLRSVRDWTGAVYDELSDLRVERWQRNGVFLLGDAAHAMTPNLGQGANSAMVDALVLVNLLTEVAPQRAWREAGRRYEQLRRPFVTKIQNAALLGGRLASWRNPVTRAVRDSLFRVITNFPPLLRSSLLLSAGYNPAEQHYLRTPVRIAGY